MAQGGKKAGFVFTSDKSTIGLQRTGSFQGFSGQHMLSSSMNIPAFNADVKKWGFVTSSHLKRSVASLSKGKSAVRIYNSGIHQGKKERKLQQSIKATFQTEQGGAQIESIGFGLERHGVFLQKGVGRGYSMQGGSAQRTATNEPIAFRTRNNWYNSVLEFRKENLAKVIVKHTGNSIVMNTKRMFIQ